MYKFNRVFNGQDMFFPRDIDFIDDSGESSRLTGAGRTGDEDNAARLLRDDFKAGRRFEFFQTKDFSRNSPANDAWPASLLKEVDTESSFRMLKAEVIIAEFFEDFILFVIGNFFNHGIDVIAGEVRSVETLDIATHSNHGREST